MRSRSQRVLSIAVASGKLGMVYLVDGELMDWELSSNATFSIERLAKKVNKWMSFYQPDLVITEKVTRYSRKSNHTHSLIEAIVQEVKNAQFNHIEVERIPSHGNKYDEIKQLCIQFPQIADHAPQQPKIWMSEPKATIYFEALSMATQLSDPPSNLPI